MAKNALTELAAVIATKVDSLASEAKEKPVTSKALLTKDDKFAALKSVQKALDKQLETTNSLMRLGSKVGIAIPSISTNLPTLDYEVLGCGGVPRGRIVEIYGPESSGKTTLCLHLIAQEQQNTDNLCAIIDAEHAIDVTYAAKLGVNIDELLISQPSSGEDALETAEALIDSECVSLIVIDSVAALVPRAELDGEMGEASMGLQARLMSQACRKLVGKASAKQVTVLFINQLRDRIGVMYGSPETTTGGKALKFYASVRLDVRRRDLIGPKESPLGHQLRIKASKNKCGVPLKETTINLMYETGIDTFADFVTYAVNMGAINQKGAWYDFQGERIGQGVANVIEALRTNPDLFEKIHLTVEEARAKVNTDGKD